MAYIGLLISDPTFCHTRLDRHLNATLALVYIQLELCTWIAERPSSQSGSKTNTAFFVCQYLIYGTCDGIVLHLLKTCLGSNKTEIFGLHFWHRRSRSKIRNAFSTRPHWRNVLFLLALAAMFVDRVVRLSWVLTCYAYSSVFHSFNKIPQLLLTMYEVCIWWLYWVSGMFGYV